MGYRSRRMILRRDCDRERAVAAIRALGAADPPVPTGLRDLYEAPGEITVVLDHDERTDRLFVQVLGESADRVGATCHELERALGPWSCAALLDLHDRLDGEPERGEALALLGLGAPPHPDDDFTKRIVAGLHDPRALVREGALLAAQRYSLPDFAPRLREMAEAEPEPGLRETASLVVDITRRTASPSRPPPDRG